MKNRFIITVALLLLMLFFIRCNKTVEKKFTLNNPVETILCDYRETDNGMYSSFWAVNFISESNNGQEDWFIELNGNKIGPFERICNKISFSPNGRNVVFAAKKKDISNWDVYLNGEIKWSYDKLAWASYTWSAGLNRKIVHTMTSAVIFNQSNDNENISFLTHRKDAEKNLWANVLNGKTGKFYHEVGSRIQFINGKVVYWAWKSDKEKYLVVGNIEYGPYENAHSLKFSEDKKHYAFIAERDGKSIFVLDGVEKKVQGKIEAIAIGKGGCYALAYNKKASMSDFDNKGEVHIDQNGIEWPKTFSEMVWHQIRMTQDARVLAGWFKKDGKWYIVANGKIMYGPYDSYFFIDAGDLYGLFLGKSGENIAYFIRNIEGFSTGMKFYLNGKEFDYDPSFGGLSIGYYQDDYGEVNGITSTSSVDVDIDAVADAANKGAKDPLIARYLGTNLIYSLEKEDSVFVNTNDLELGPYLDANSFIASPSQDNYGFIAVDHNGKYVIINGEYRTPYYDEIYRLQFEDENEIGFLTVKDNKVVRVFGTF